MNSFDELKSLYTQIFNTNDEILEYLNKEWYNEANLKSDHFSDLTTHINFAKKGMKFTEDEKKEVAELDKKASELIMSTLDKLVNLKIKTKQDLDNTKNKVKLTSTYSQDVPVTGQLFNEEE